MTNFISALNEILSKLGLILAPFLIKILGLMYKQAEAGSMIPCALLKGVPGSGKTSTAEAFALAVDACKFFYQVNPGTGFDQLIGQPNLSAVLRQDASSCISDGILVKAVKAAMEGQDVVLILDEIDKSSPEVDSYLLDFLQSRRIHDSNMEELVVPSDVKFWVFLTSNDERELSDALMRRVRRVTVDRPDRATVAKVIGIKESAALLDIWQNCENLAISQLKQYLEDGGDPEDIDIDILSQYVDDIPSGNDDYDPVKISGSLTDFRSLDVLNHLVWEPGHYQGDIIIHLKHTDDLITVCKYKKDNYKINFIQGDNGYMVVNDWIKPVINNQHGGIFQFGDITMIATRDKSGRYIIPGGPLYYMANDFPDKLYEFAREADKIKTISEHENGLKEARQKASEGEAYSLLKKLGLDDLI